MHILLLSQWCPPEPEFRALNLGASLVEHGHQVTLITAFPNYPLGRIYPGYKQRLWQQEEKFGVQIVRLPVYPDHSRSSIRRMLTYFSFALSASMLAPFFTGKPDVMWVYHPPLTIGIPAMWISLLRHVPFVYEIQDMWPEAVISSRMLDSSLPIRMLNVLASVIYRRAAAITVISEGFKANLIEKGVPADKVTVIPNWADESIYYPVERSAALGESYGLVEHFNVIFAGTMGPGQHLETVLDAAKLLLDLHNLQFVFIGDGIDLPNLKARVATEQLANIRFIERQPPDQMPAFFAWGDALLVQLRDDPIYHMTIPSKTLAYLACGRPILCAVPGDGAEVIRAAGAGIVCPPDDPQGLANAVRRMYQMSAEERAVMGNAGRQAYLARFARTRLLMDYTQVFQTVVKSRKTS